ncbi:hypothetical protein ACC806_03635 [Rhizobium ruizarguesonis]
MKTPILCFISALNVIGDSTLRTLADWRAIGFDEGVKAGLSEMTGADYEFGPDERGLAMGHDLFDGRYALVRRNYGDFDNHDMCASWMAGVLEGCTSVDARLGQLVRSPDTVSSGPVVLNLMIVNGQPTEDSFA